MEKAIQQGQWAYDESLSLLCCAAYFIGKEFLPYTKFLCLCALRISVNAHIIAWMYQNEKVCVDLIACMSIVIQKKSIYRVWNSPLFGIMIDESIDISVTSHLVVFVTIIKEGLPLIIFLGL